MSESHTEVVSVRPPWTRDLEEGMNAKLEAMKDQIDELEARLVPPADGEVNICMGATVAKTRNFVPRNSHARISSVLSWALRAYKMFKRRLELQARAPT